MLLSDTSTALRANGCSSPRGATEARHAAIANRITRAVRAHPRGRGESDHERNEAAARRACVSLAQVAEQLEKTNDLDPPVRRANIERYERLLAAALDERTRSIVETLLSEENAALDKKRRQIEAWRRRAEELRATADQMGIPSIQETLQRTAANLEMLADHAEGVLTGKPKAPGDKAG